MYSGVCDQNMSSARQKTSTSPHNVLKSHFTRLLDAITLPDKLANDLSAVDLISGPVRNRVLEVPIYDNYKQASILVNEVQTSLRLFNDPAILVKFCNVLKKQDDPKLLRIANDMLVDIGIDVPTKDIWHSDNVLGKKKCLETSRLRKGRRLKRYFISVFLIIGVVIVCYVSIQNTVSSQVHDLDNPEEQNKLDISTPKMLDLKIIQNFIQKSNNCDLSVQNHNKPRRYVFLFHIWEQLDHAVYNTIDGVYLAKALNAQVVEPLLGERSAQLYTLELWCAYKQNMVCTKDRNIETIFDKESMEAALCNHGLPLMASLTEFLTNSHRDIVFLNPIYTERYSYTGQGVDSNIEETLLGFKTAPSVSCAGLHEPTSLAENALELLNLAAKKHNAAPFRKVGCYSIDAWYNYDLEDVDKTITSSWHLERSNISVFFLAWGGFGFRRMTMKNLPKSRRQLSAFPYSRDVLKKASVFFKSITNNKNVVGVHIRAERLGEKKEFLLPNPDRYGYNLFDWCIEQTHQKATQLATSHNADIIYISDIGQEGTSTCYNYECPGFTWSSKSFAKYNIEPSQYDNKRFHGYYSPAFTASVEKSSLLFADYLVIVGGGNFQHDLERRFLMTHSPGHVYHCCYQYSWEGWDKGYRGKKGCVTAQELIQNCEHYNDFDEENCE